MLSILGCPSRGLILCLARTVFDIALALEMCVKICDTVAVELREGCRAVAGLG
jgi:hypothetical protein